MIERPIRYAEDIREFKDCWASNQLGKGCIPEDVLQPAFSNSDAAISRWNAFWNNGSLFFREPSDEQIVWLALKNLESEIYKKEFGGCDFIVEGNRADHHWILKVQECWVVGPQKREIFLVNKARDPSHKELVAKAIQVESECLQFALGVVLKTPELQKQLSDKEQEALSRLKEKGVIEENQFVMPDFGEEKDNVVKQLIGSVKKRFK